MRKPGDMFPATVHVDLDGARAIYTIHGWEYPHADDPLFVSGLRHAMDWLDKVNVRATLFVIAEDLEDPAKLALLREAGKRGHRFGSHTITHRKLTGLAPEEKRKEICESRQRIADALGVEVLGFRAPGFAIDQESLELVAEAGYTYDSSFLAGKLPPSVAGTQIPAAPHAPLRGRTLLEIPVPAWTQFSMPFHPCYALALGNWYFRAGLHGFRKTAAPLILLFHLTDLAAPMPHKYLDGWTARFFTLSFMSAARKRQKCDDMLAMVRRNYSLVDADELLLAVGSAGMPDCRDEGRS